MIPAGHEPKALKLDSYGAIIRYFLPEFVNAFLLYFMIVFIDARLVAGLKSTTAYAMVGVTNQLMLFINKVAEGLCIGTVILCGQYQGRKEYEMVGKVAVAAMWATFFVGASIASFLYFNAAWMYRNVLCLPEEMIAIGVPFIRLRAVSILLMFVYLSLIGFYRGVRNTKATMYFYLMGATAFLFSDYALIHGNFGFPAMGFNGSAIASIIEYSTMLTAAILYIVLRKEYRQYNFNFRVFKPQLLKNLFSLSWPVMFDKAALQLEKVWVVSLIAPMGAVALGGLNVVKDMEGLVFLAAAAMGQIVTILVSNEFGAGNYAAIKQSIKRGLIIAFSIMLVVLVALALKPLWFIQMFDKQNAFTSFATKAFPLVGILTFFDLLQLVLAAALRGTSNVKVVMWTRVFSALVLFIPISYAISRIPFESNLMRFVAIYGSFNLVNCFSSAVYYYWFHAGFWLRSKEKSV